MIWRKPAGDVQRGLHANLRAGDEGLVWGAKREGSRHRAQAYRTTTSALIDLGLMENPYETPLQDE